MTTELTDTERQELFAQASKAISDADNTKLNELFSEDETVDTGAGGGGADDGAGVEGGEATPANEDEGRPQEGADGGAQGGGEGTDDPLAELRGQLEAMRKENHALRSQAGRIPHVQRKIKELDEKLELLNKQASSPSSRPSAAIQEKVLAALKGISETDSELANAIAAAMSEATLGHEEHSINRERETLKLLRDQEYASYQAGEVSRLLEMYPNAKEVFASPSWKQWRTDQSDRVQSLANSDNADDVALAFKLYADDMVAKNPELSSAAKAKEEEAKRLEENARKAEQIELERKRKQEGSVAVGSPSAQGKVSLPDDPAALFAKFSETIRKDISGR